MLTQHASDIARKSALDVSFREQLAMDLYRDMFDDDGDWTNWNDDGKAEKAVQRADELIEALAKTEPS